VLGLNCLDGLSKRAADGDTVSCAAADRPAHRIFPTGSGKKTLSHAWTGRGGLQQKVGPTPEISRTPKPLLAFCLLMAGGLRPECLCQATSIAVANKLKIVAGRSVRLAPRPRGKIALLEGGSTEPIPWPGPSTPRSICWICKFAFVNGKTSASDALRQSRSETLKLSNPLIDPLCPCP